MRNVLPEQNRHGIVVGVHGTLKPLLIRISKYTMVLFIRTRLMAQVCLGGSRLGHRAENILPLCIFLRLIYGGLYAMFLGVRIKQCKLEISVKCWLLI